MLDRDPDREDDKDEDREEEEEEEDDDDDDEEVGREVEEEVERALEVTAESSSCVHMVGNPPQSSTSSSEKRVKKGRKGFWESVEEQAEDEEGAAGRS